MGIGNKRGGSIGNKGGHGGAKPGAGRKKGSKALHTAQDIADLLKHRDSGIMPREFLLGIMRDERYPIELRVDCARAAAPYCHSRFAQIEAKIEAEVTTKQDPLAIAQRIAFALQSGMRKGLAQQATPGREPVTIEARST